MIVKEKKFQDENGNIGYYEGIYNSSNILKTTYFPQENKLYISFNRGGVYSYTNIPIELYEEFKNAESQGKFFAKTIKSQPQKYTYRKEFTLFPEEVKELKEVVETHLKSEEDDEEEVLIHVGETEDDIYEISSPEDPKNIIFNIEDEEFVRINPDGFHWKGNLVQEDKEIYDRFKLWLDMAFGQLSLLKNEESGVVELLKKVLGFYSHKDNYKQKTRLNEELTSTIELDKGEQARQVLKLVDNLQREKEKMEQDYDKIMEEELKNSGDPEKMKNLINSIKKSSKK